MSLLDLVTGGYSRAAGNAMNRARQDYENVALPSQAELTMPELQQYVMAGILTPAQAQAYLQDKNAFNEMNIPQTGTAAQIAALNQLSGVANAGPMGTPVEQAQVAQALGQVNNAMRGQRGAIEQAMEAKGTPGALIQAALANQTLGQEGTMANQAALGAQSNAYQAALDAMSKGGALGGQLQGQQNQQANTVAAAQNAMQQFNAANQQAASEANAGRQQQANEYNTQTRQNVSNQNTGLANTRTAYNVQVPQQMFQNRMSRAAGMAGADTGLANLNQQQGQQTAGLYSGLLNAGVGLFAPGVRASGGQPGGIATAFGGQQGQTYAPSMSQMGYAKGGIVDHDHSVCMARGGVCMKEGGMVPGEPEVNGDSLRNDNVSAMLSPGEAVIPRTEVSKHLPTVLRMLSGHGHEPPPNEQPAHPQDVATLLRAMKAIRLGVA